MTLLPAISPQSHVLIAGATASGKSDLALRIVREQGGLIVNADASQVYDCWRIITARPSEQEESMAPHRLYGHLPYNAPYSVGHWLREIEPILQGPDRVVVVGGTGLNFAALTQGLADIPPTPPSIRDRANATGLETLLDEVDPETLRRIDTANRARVQRAWEVQASTGRPLHLWQDETGPPLLALADTVPIVVDIDKQALDARIEQRFDAMIAGGALDEVAAMLPHFDSSLPAFKAIGVPELAGHLTANTPLEDARDKAIIATRQFAKRQRTWMRSRMKNWAWVNLEKLS